MNDEEIKDLSVQYSLGILDETTANEFEKYLETAAEEIQCEANELREVAAQLPFALPQESAPAYLKQEIFARIAQESHSGSTSNGSSSQQRANVITFPQQTKREAQPRQWWLIAATIAFATLSAVLLWQNQRLATQRDQLASDLDSYAKELSDQRRELIAKQQEIGTITAPTTRIIAMSGEAQAPQASAKLVWDKANNQWLIYFYNLPAAPPDKDYQLWYITSDSAKISARVFKTSEQGHTELRVAVPQDIASRLALAAVTLEPKNGSPQPTGPIYIKGVI